MSGPYINYREVVSRFKYVGREMCCDCRNPRHVRTKLLRNFQDQIVQEQGQDSCRTQITLIFISIFSQFLKNKIEIIINTHFYIVMTAQSCCNNIMMVFNLMCVYMWKRRVVRKEKS